jgi:hypothetical protein
MSWSVLDFARPYEIMMGMWAGSNIVYGPDGRSRPAQSGPSRVSIYWKDHKTIHYRQLARQNWLDTHVHEIEESHRQHATGLMFISFDLDVTDKRGVGGGMVRTPEGQEVAVDAEGTETVPGIYLFRLAYQNGQTFYNNQYFLDSNQRNIVGPLVMGEQTVAVIAQSFTRISYDVPKQYQWDLDNVPQRFRWVLPKVKPQHALK